MGSEVLGSKAAEPHSVARGGGIILVIALANLAAWAWASIFLAALPEAMAVAGLAYALGLKHAVDADHIAAIDNVTRKLVGEGRRSFATGLWFSLGHSTIVVLVTFVIALASADARDRLQGLAAGGALFGTAVSILFLALIGGGNLRLLMRLWQRREDSVGRPGVPGAMGRLLAPLLGLVSRAWHLYPVGLLFGLGFDTASEIGMLGLSAAAAVHGLPAVAILTYPLLFTAAMLSVDALDGVLMSGLYGWARRDSARKRRYDLAVTGFSVAVAFGIGGIEVAGLVADGFGLDGGLWAMFSSLNDRFGSLGLLVIGGFVGLFLSAYLIDRRRRPTAA